MFQKMSHYMVAGLAALLLVLTGCDDTGTDGVWDPKITEFDRIYGDANAPVTMIEYASLTCPHCANFHANIFPQFKKEYIDTGKVRMIYRDFPLNQPALQAAQLARCVPEDQYFAWIELLYTNLRSWANANALENLAKMAVMGGIGREKFDACMENTDIRDKIIQGQLNGERDYGVQATPSFVIEGNLMNRGGSLANLRAAIDPLLK